MRLEQSLASVQSFFENVGYCRFSAFYSPSNRDRAVLVEMAGRLAVGLFAAISIYDLATKSLPFGFRIVVHGTMLSIITSLGLSLLLKKVLPALELKPEVFTQSELSDAVMIDPPDEEERGEGELDDKIPVFEKKSSDVKSFSQILNTPYAIQQDGATDEKATGSLPLSRVRRNLMVDFAKLEREDKEKNVGQVGLPQRKILS